MVHKDIGRKWRIDFLMSECFTILSQSKKSVHMCKDIMIVSHSSDDYLRPFWVVTGDENEFMLGCYETDLQAKNVIKEIFKCDGKYEMPMWNDVEGDSLK